MNAWDYKCWQAFHEKTFKKTLSAEHIKGRKFFLEAVNKVDDKNQSGVKKIVRALVNKNVFKVEKNGELYILEELDALKVPLMPVSTSEVFIKQSDTTLYKYITNAMSVKIAEQHILSFKDFITSWNPVGHSEERTRLFLNILMIALQHNTTNIFVCGAPGSMKNANLTISKYIFDNVARHGTITRARLETSLHYNKVVNLDELTSVTKASLEEVEATLLQVTDNSTEYEKGSMAQNTKLQKTNISGKSIILTYNRVQDVKKYNKKKQFIEEKWGNPNALRRRFLAVLIPGKVTSARQQLHVNEAVELMEENYAFMKQWAGMAVYFANHLHEHTHGWKEEVPLLFSDNQQRLNTTSVLLGFDAISDTQEEYNEWCKWFNKCITAYDEMLATIQDVEELGVDNPWARYAEPKNKDEGLDLFLGEEEL
jgi:hypothetical protein